MDEVNMAAMAKNEERLTAGQIRRLISGSNIPALQRLIEGKSDEQEIDLIDKNDYVAVKLWSEDDIAGCLEEKGFPAAAAHIAEVLNHGAASALGDCTEEEWECIYSAIYNCISQGAFPRHVKVEGPIDKGELEGIPFDFDEDLPETVIEQIRMSSEEFVAGEYYEVFVYYGLCDANDFNEKAYIAKYLGDRCWEAYKNSANL